MQKTKDNIGSLFNRIAAGYDRFNHLSSLGIDTLWRKKAIKHLKKADNVLDVAIGTGDFAIEMVRRGKAERVTGVDLSTEMMRVGEEKVRRLGWQDRIQFREASALDLPYEDNSFDTVTCAYGVRNFSDLDRGLSEFQRVLRPGGQLLILEFSYPQNRIFAFVYDLYFRYVLTTIGRLMTNDKSAFNYFYASVRHFIWGEQMLEHLRQAGFTRAEYHTMTFGISTFYTATK